jgi:hypothetical protein
MSSSHRHITAGADGRRPDACGAASMARHPGFANNIEYEKLSYEDGENASLSPTLL